MPVKENLTGTNIEQIVDINIMSRALKNLISSIESHCCSPMSKDTGKKLCVYHGWNTPSFFFVTEGYCKLMMVGTWMSPYHSMALENLARAINNKKEHAQHKPYLSHGRSHVVYSDNSDLLNTIYVEHLIEAAEMLPDDWPGHDLKIKEIYESEPAFNIAELSKQVSAALKKLGVQTRSALLVDLAMGVYDNTLYTQYISRKLIEHGYTPSPCLETLAQLPLKKIRSLCTYEKSRIYELHICKYRDGTCRLDVVNRAVVDTSWASFCLDILPVRNSQADKNKIVKEAIQYCIDAEKIYRFVDGYWYVNKDQINACINAVLKLAVSPVSITGNTAIRWMHVHAPDVSDIFYPDVNDLLHYRNKLHSTVDECYVWRFSARELDKLISILGPQWPYESNKQLSEENNNSSDNKDNEGDKDNKDSSHNNKQSESESPSHNRGPESQEKSGQAAQKQSSEDDSSSQEREDSSQEGSQNGSGGSNNNQSQNSSNKQGQNSSNSSSGANSGSQQSSGENNSQSCGEDSESSDNNHSSGESSSSAGGDESSQKGGDASADHKSASVAGDESERCSDSSSATERSPHDKSPKAADPATGDAQATEASKQDLCERGTSAQSNRDLSGQDAGGEERSSEGKAKDVSGDEPDSSSSSSSDSSSPYSSSNNDEKEDSKDASELSGESSESSRSEDQQASDLAGSSSDDSQSESSEHGYGSVSGAPKQSFGGDHRDQEQIKNMAAERRRLMICMKIAKIIDNLVDSATYGEDNPALRYDARKLVKEIVTKGCNLTRARKSTSSKKKVIIAPDVSGSCHKYASLMSSVAQLLWKINPERYVMMLHSNGYVVSCAVSKSEIKNYGYSEITIEDLTSSLNKSNNVALFMGIGDSDALYNYLNVGANVRTLLLYLEKLNINLKFYGVEATSNQNTFRLLTSSDKQKIAVVDHIYNENDILAALYKCCQSTIISKLRELPAKQ